MKTYRDFGIEVPYGRTYGQIKTYCPQCRDKRTNKRDKSLSVDLANGVWNCHYCGWHGYLSEERDMNTQANSFRRPQKPTYKLPKTTGQSQLSEKALAWFKSRGISEETLTKMRVTEGKEFMPQKGEQVNTIQFNYYKDGQLVNTKFRTGDKCFKLVPGAELLPYNIDSIKDSPTCIITEGEADTLSFVECGRMDVVSVPNGANANLQYLDDYIESHFEDKETIFIASDTDTKGLALRDELIRRFGADKCRIVSYGDGCKDANEHLQKYGKESLLQCLEYATEPKVEGIFCVSDLRSELDALFRNGMQKGYTIGDENLDKLISFETKKLCIITGIPGCLDENTLVDMADGTRKKISDIEVGDEVQILGVDNWIWPNKVLNKWDSGIKECYEIVTRDGHRITATDEHRFLTFDGWKELKDIKVGEFIGSPVRFNGKDEMNEDMLKLTAIWLAEGHKCHSCYSITNNTPEIIDELARICERNNLNISFNGKYNYTVSVNKPVTATRKRYVAMMAHWLRNQKGIDWESSERLANEKYEQRISTPVSLLNPLQELKDMGCGQWKSNELRVPSKIMRLSNEQIAIFLNYLFACDGSFYRGQIEYCSISYGLCEDIQILLSRFDINSTVREKKVKYNNTKRIAYVLSIDAYDSVYSFTRLIGITGKQDKMDEYIANNSPNIYKADYIPSSIKEKLAHGEKFYKKHLGFTMSMNDKDKIRVNRRMVIECAKLQSDGWQIVSKLDRGCRWREIKSITPVGEKHTYDIEVEHNHNFFANGIVTHNSGKSAFLNYFAMKMNIRYDWRFAFYSPESMPLSQHIGTITELFTGKKFNTASTNDAEYQQAINHLDKNFFFIAPEEDVTLDSILEKAKILIRRKGIKALIIDPYNRVEHNYDKNLTETQAVSKFLDKLTIFAQRYDILVILMAHPAKMPKNRDGVEEIPTLYDISGSANFFNKADFGIVVHRDRLENITKVLVKKVKFRHLGENGEAHYKFNLNNGRYVPYEGESYIPYDNRNYIIDKYNAEAVQEAFDDFPSDDFLSDFT